MTLTQLEYVLALNKFRHFKRAATSCHVAQPTLSLQLQKLEEELDLIIFDRSKKPILPTKVGEDIIKQASIILKESSRLVKMAHNKENELCGRFVLSVIPTLAPYVIPLFLNSFAQKYPDIDLVIQEHKTEEIIDLLAEDKIDAGILVSPLGVESYIERVLFYEPFYLFSSPHHPYVKLKKIREGEISQENLWLLEDGHCFKSQVLKVCSHEGFVKQNLHNITFESGSLETIKKLILRGTGYTLLPYLATLDIESKYKKCLKEFFDPVPTREVSLVHSRSFLKEAIIIALESEIISSLPKALLSRKRDPNRIEID